MKGATMDDLQALIEDNMERMRASLPGLREEQTKMEGEEAAKMAESIAGLEGILAQYDEMRAKAIEAARAEE
jgi:hypothetical protein